MHGKARGGSRTARFRGRAAAERKGVGEERMLKGPALNRHHPSPFAPPSRRAGSELVEGLFFPCDAEKKERCFDKLSTNGRKGGADLGLAEIGRASCRASVCQYV